MLILAIQTSVKKRASLPAVPASEFSFDVNDLNRMRAFCIAIFDSGIHFSSGSLSFLSSVERQFDISLSMSSGGCAC